MGVSKKDIGDVAKLSAMILGTGITGGTLAAAAPAVGFFGKLLAGNDEDDDEERAELAWRVKMIPGWKAKALELMDKPMSSDTRARVLGDRIEADWFDHFGERPKKSYVNKLREDVVFSVKAHIASEERIDE